MKYSVVIPAYNDSDVLEKCLKHLEDVDFDERFEVVVVNDGSTDNTDEVLLNWQRKSKKFDLKFESQENLGAAAARNRGVEIATGDVVLFIGADILVSRAWLKNHARFHDANGEAVAVGYMTWSPELADDRFRCFLEDRGIALSFKGLKDECETDFWHFFTGNISMPKWLFERYRFDEDFMGYGFEDIMLGYRMAQDNVKIFYLEKALAWHHHALEESDFFPGRMRKIGESAVLFDNKFPKAGVLPGVFKKTIFVLLSWFSWPLSLFRKEWGWYAKSKRYFLQGIRLGSAKKSVLIIGSYGAGNLGDEAMLEVILRELPVNYKRAVLSGDIKDTKARHDVEAGPHFPFGLRSFLKLDWFKSLRLLKKSSLVLLGGGGLFTDSYCSKAVYLWAWHVFIAKKFGKPVYLFANSFGPVKGFFTKRLAKWALAQCEKIILRDELSANVVKKMGDYKVIVGFDPVILFEPVRENGAKKKVAVNLRPLKRGGFDSVKLIDNIKSRGYEPVFVAMERMDGAVMKEFGEVVYPTDFGKVVDVLADCEFCIGMRLHFLIAGVLAGCKVAGLSYNLKVAGILDVLDLPYVRKGELNTLMDEARVAKNIEVACKDAKKIFSQV